MPPCPGMSGIPAAAQDGSDPPASSRVYFISAVRVASLLQASTDLSDMATGKMTSFGAWKAQIGVSFSAEAASLNGGRSPPDTGAIAAQRDGLAAARFHVPMEPWLRPVR